MSRDPHASARRAGLNGILHRLRERGVVRVAASYAVIAWLLLQIADVTLEPLGAPPWAMIALISAAAVGLPIALAMAWFLEIGADGVQVDTAADGATRPQVRGLRHYVDAIVIGALVIVVAVLLVRQSDLGKPKPAASPAIAVLPFENLSGDPEQDYFSDGLAEEMLDRLGRVPGLKVIARSSSFGFKGSKLDAKSIAERLGVTTVLEGSVRRDGKRLRLTARLIDGATGQQAWSGSFDRELTDIFAVQAELAGAVVDAIIPAARGTLVADAAPSTRDLNAYDLYLLARGQLAARTPESMEKSVELTEDAVRLDPAFARAWAHLAASLLFQRSRATEEDPAQAKALERRAEAAIHKALALDPDLSEAHGAYATLLRDTEQPGAEERYKRALELNPNNAAAWHDYAVYLGNVAGRPEESHKATANSLELDPRQLAAWMNYLPRVVEPGGQRFRAEFRRAVRSVGDLQRAMDRLMMLGILLGYPVEVMEAGVAKQRIPVEGNLPLWITEARAWLLVDPDRASRSLQGEAARGPPLHRMYPGVLLFLTIEVAGRREDWPDLDRAVDRALTRFREEMSGDETVIRSTAAFWLSVQGRDEEAAQSLQLAEPLQESAVVAFLGRDMEHGMADLAQLRIYRATGRGADAERLAGERLAQMREMRRAAGAGCILGTSPVGWARYAGLAASEGLKDEAVQALRRAMSCSDLPFGFWPRLPWFRSLEGYAPYDELLRERERRVQRITKELERLESLAGGWPP